MDNGTKAEIRELIRESSLAPSQLEQARAHLAGKYRLLSREAAGFAIGAIVAFFAAVGLLSWSAAAAAIGNALSNRGVAVAVANVKEYAKQAKTYAAEGFPVGSIIAWHDNILSFEHDGAGTRIQSIILSDNGPWLRCDGQKLTRHAHGEEYKDLFAKLPDGVDEIKLPKLNNENGRFLRGGESSGTLQDGMVKQHKHKSPRKSQYTIFHVGGTEGIRNPNSGLTFSGDDSTGDMKNGGGSETRPTNMSVVWIIRVK